jgi:SIR2-like domain
VATNKSRERAEAISDLHRSFEKHELTLFLGVGVSVASGIPAWRDLILNVLLNSLATSSIGMRPIGESGKEFEAHHFVQAAAEEWFSTSELPLDVAARGLRAAFNHPDQFLKWVRYGLYSGIKFDSRGNPTPLLRARCLRNPTLRAVTALCKASRMQTRGVSTVVNYNLDGLLEITLGRYPHQSLWKKMLTRPDLLPIYHVHGFLPVLYPFRPYGSNRGSLAHEIVLTEDHYHREAADPYSWANLVQLRAMSAPVGLTIGLSMSDPNMRRLLDVSRRAPTPPRIYALLPMPKEAELMESSKRVAIAH